MMLRAYKNFAYNAVEIFARDEGGAFATPTFQSVEPGVPGPRLALLEDRDAQRLMDDLWESGFRPTEGAGSAGSLAATQHHLKDLQRIVFKDFPSA